MEILKNKDWTLLEELPKVTSGESVPTSVYFFLTRSFSLQKSTNASKMRIERIARASMPRGTVIV